MRGVAHRRRLAVPLVAAAVVVALALGAFVWGAVPAPSASTGGPGEAPQGGTVGTAGSGGGEGDQRAAEAVGPQPQAAPDTRQFRDAVTAAGVLEHLRAFQSIADGNGGHRASGTPGYDASAQYVHDTLAAAGYAVRFEEFRFLLVTDRTPPVLDQVAPVRKSYVAQTDIATMAYSGSAEVSAEVVAVNLVVPSARADASTSGCEAADFAAFPRGAVALIQRGKCTFRIKAENAAAAGAAAVVIFNEGGPGRTELIPGTLGPPQVRLPVLGATFALGQELRHGVLNGRTGVRVHLRTDTVAEDRPTRNVIAETPGGDPDHVVVVGAHLDSVVGVAGINDNGSGSAAILEVAQALATRMSETRNKLRFIWFAAEEAGLHGSLHHVQALPQAEHENIELMLNLDMVGSPNFVRSVYGTSGFAPPLRTPAPSTEPSPAAPSGGITQVFLDYFQSVGLPVQITPIHAASDHAPFMTAGIPVGGLFTGAQGAKSGTEATTYGGSAGEPYDPCYHRSCDRYANVSEEALDQMSDALAHAVLVFSQRDFANEPLAAGDGRRGMIERRP